MTSTGTARPHGRTWLALGGLLGAVVVPIALAGPASAAVSKTTICHATNSHTNPYRRISVPQSALNRHGAHHGASAVWAPAIGTRWDDVIPDGSGGRDGSNGVKTSWTTAGIAVYDGVTLAASGRQACRSMSAKEYYDSEIAAGIGPAAVLADLNDQAANEDAPLRAALGGSFTLDGIAMLDAVRATTDAASGVAATLASLHGTAALGRDSADAAAGETASLSFVWGTDPNLVDATAVAASPGSATGGASSIVSTSASAPLSGLSPSTTYWFRFRATVDAGLETQGVLEGAIASFTTTGAATQALTFDQPAPATAGDAARTLAPTASSGLPVTLAATGPGCSVTGLVVSFPTAGTCTLTATQPGDGTWAPAAPVVRTLEVSAGSAAPVPTAQTISLDAGADGVLGDLPRTVTATATSQLPVVLSVATSSVGTCTVDGSTVSLVAAGLCELVASQAGSEDWLPATSVTEAFSISRRTQTLAFDPPGVVTLTADPAPVVVVPVSDSGLPVAVGTSTPLVCRVSGAAPWTVTPLAAGACALVAEQAGSAVWLPAVPLTRTLTVLAAVVPDPVVLVPVLPVPAPPVPGTADPTPLVPVPDAPVPVAPAPVAPVPPAAGPAPVLPAPAPAPTPVVTAPAAAPRPVLQPRPSPAAAPAAATLDRRTLVAVPKVLPKDSGAPMRKTTLTDRSATGRPAPSSATLSAKTRLRPGQGVTLPGQVLFEFNSAVLTARGRVEVKKAAGLVQGNRTVACEGYADYAGSRSNEISLSNRRAKAVCAALLGYGAKVRTTSAGYGPSKPVVVGGKARDRHDNRRVVVVVLT